MNGFFKTQSSNSNNRRGEKTTWARAAAIVDWLEARDGRIASRKHTGGCFQVELFWKTRYWIMNWKIELNFSLFKQTIRQNELGGINQNVSRADLFFGIVRSLRYCFLTKNKSYKPPRSIEKFWYLIASKINCFGYFFEICLSETALWPSWRKSLVGQLFVR